MDSFDFGKQFVFKSLPAVFANQHLCIDKPALPLNRLLYLDYMQMLALWEAEHEECFNCLPPPPRHLIADLHFLDSEDCVQILPRFITEQFLFEDEPVNIPADVESFFVHYVSSTTPWAEYTDRETVEQYHQDTRAAYPKALEQWRLACSEGKRDRYETFRQARQRYLSLRSIKTIVNTVAAAATAEPIIM